MPSSSSLDVGYFFGEFQCLPVDDGSAVSCDAGAPARGSERTSLYSAILTAISFKALKVLESKIVKNNIKHLILVVLHFWSNYLT